MKRLKKSLSRSGRALTPIVGLIAFFCALLPTLSEAKTVYVRGEATGTTTGASWADAYTSLQDGLTAIVAGDELWVAAGTYKPDQGTGFTPGNRDATFNIKANVGVYGGFAGHETTVTQRDWYKNKTVFSGDLLGNDTPSFINYGENALNVVTFERSDAPVLLDGVTITGGNATLYRGGGINIYQMSPVVRNCIITQNKSDNDGGGVYVGPGSNARFENCIIRNNIAYRGGGISYHLSMGDSGQLVLSGCTVINNLAVTGGGIDHVGPTLVENSIVWGNSAATGPQIAKFSDDLSVRTSDIQGGKVQIYVSSIGTGILTYQDNIASDPMLTVDGRLQAGSPCIDGADPATALAKDVDGESRPQGMVPDMGADEWSDTDGDSLPDTWETIWFGGLAQNGNSDADNDGLTNLAEFQAGTNPTLADTDKDGYPDPDEIGRDADPLNSFNHPGRIYVKADAAGDSTGISWASAYTNLQDGLAAAWPGCQIWVAAGTYKPDQGKGLTRGNRSATFNIASDIGIHGGFSGNETALSERDWNKNRTILSGDLRGNDDPFSFIGHGDNSLAVVTVPGGALTTVKAILDGLTVTGGNGFTDSNLMYGDAGAGITSGNSRGASLVIRNCIISRNQSSSGSGIKCIVGNLRLENTVIENNKARTGAGIILGAAKAMISDCTFSGNLAADGGAIWSTDSILTIAGSSFTNNQAQSSTNINSGRGGALANGGASILTIARSTFTGNAAINGGALNGIGVTNYLIEVYDSIFRDNTASEGGGGLFFSGYTIPDSNHEATVTLTGNIIEHNTAPTGGGVMTTTTYYVEQCAQYGVEDCIRYEWVEGYIVDSPLTMTNTIIRANVAKSGGGLHLEGATTLTNCTIADNAASTDGGALGIDALINYPKNIAILNSTLWGNTAPVGPQINVIGGSLRITYSDVQGGQGAVNTGGTVTYENNISQNPLLTADGHLQAGSPCIDGGDPAATLTTDIDGETRPGGAGIDMGADEFIDTDADGLPDYWELSYGLDPRDNGAISGKNGASGDPDGDGLTNLEEYVGGNSPLVVDVQPDKDGDGYNPLQGDCNDADYAVHPGAEENCSDAIDNDCNGLTDAADPACSFSIGMECLYDAQCAKGLYCKKDEGICDGGGSCQPLPASDTVCPLTLVYAPVCGCDGKTYAGACEAGLAGVNVAAQGECATAGYKWTYYFPSIKDNDSIGWENYLSVQAKEPVTMAVTIRVYDMGGNLAGTFIYSDTDPTAKAKAVAPNARVALRPSMIAGAAIEGSIVVETSVPAIASTNCIASYYKGFSIYEAARVKPVHYFPKAYDGPDFYQVYIVVQNIFTEPRKVTAVLSGKTTSSPGHGANQTTMIPAHGTWKFRPSDIAGGINFDGSVAVFSDLATPRDALGPAIPAMCRYEAGTEALAIYESTARQPRLFFPVLKDGKFGTTLEYQNYVSVVNMNQQPAAVTVVLYNKNGDEEGRLTDTISASGKKTWRPSTIKGTGAVPADFDGLVVINSDLTLVGQTNTIYPGTNKYGADAFDLFESSMRGKTLFFPKAYDNLLGAGTGATHLTDNFVYISNPDAGYKYLKIEQFNNNGTANGYIYYTLFPYATFVYQPKDYVTDNSGVFRGSIKVTETSGMPITGAIKYEIHKTTDPGSGIEAMSIYRSMGQ